MKVMANMTENYQLDLNLPLGYTITKPNPRKAIISLTQEHIHLVIVKKKKFEYRRVIFKKRISSILIYSIMPVGKIVSEFKVGQII